MIGRAYRTAQILSIDIVIGVVILLRFFCAQFQVDPGWQVYVLLGATVWLIYTSDHLRDADQSKNSRRERYVFHRRHRKTLTVILIIVLISIIPLVFFIPYMIFLVGIALATLSFVYLLIQHKLSRWLSKELYVALVYSIGILMVPMFLSKSFDLTTIVLLCLLSFINLTLFSWYEKNEDLNDGFKSIATQMRADTLERMMLLLTALGLAISFVSFDRIHIYFLIGFLVYALMILQPHFFRKNKRYRSVGDGIFLLPILFEWL